MLLMTVETEPLNPPVVSWNQGPGNCGITKGVEKIVEESDLVLQSQHFLTIVIASCKFIFET